MALKERWQRFVNGILKGLTAKEAYIQAGYKSRGHAAEVKASNLVRNGEVAEAIRIGSEKAKKKAELSQEWVLQRLMIEAQRRGKGASHSARVTALKLLGDTTALFEKKEGLEAILAMLPPAVAGELRAFFARAVSTSGSGTIGDAPATADPAPDPGSILGAVPADGQTSTDAPGVGAPSVPL